MNYQRAFRVCLFAQLALAAAQLLLAVARADEPPPPPPQDVWTGKGQAGFFSSHGNSESKSLNASLDVARYDGPWKHALYLGGLYGSSAGIVAAERWEGRWQSNYELTTSLFTFGALRYNHDLFSGFQYQASAAGGLGYKILDTGDTQLTVQAGVGYRSLRPEELLKSSAGEVTERIPGDRQGNAIVTAGLDYSQALTGTTTLSDKLLIESGADDTLINDTVAVAVKVSNKLALSLGYSLTNNSKPPAGLKKLDTVTTVNLVYSF